MDELVRQALAKWPNVPDCFGWLALDRRGQWRIGSDRQAITNTAIASFINRNYLQDEQSRWLFQNGPQRVFVELDYTPFVWRLLPDAEQGWTLTDHIGVISTKVSSVWLDSNGHFLIAANKRIGVLHDHDSALLSEWLCDDRGIRLDEAQASAMIEALLGHPYGSTKLYLKWLGDPQHVLPIRGVRAEEVAQRFGFDPHPMQT